MLKVVTHTHKHTKSKRSKRTKISNSHDTRAGFYFYKWCGRRVGCFSLICAVHIVHRSTHHPQCAAAAASARERARIIASFEIISYRSVSTPQIQSSGTAQQQHRIMRSSSSSDRYTRVWALFGENISHPESITTYRVQC